MSRKVTVALTALAALLILPLGAGAEGGIVQGQVINSTAGSNAALQGLAVRLYLYSGSTLKDTQETTTDARGIFRFENVPTGPAWTGIATVEYLGVEYGSTMLDLSVGSDFSGDILVYETTADDSFLRVERSHLIVEMGVGQLEVTEMIILVNDGDRTYVGSEEVVPGKRATARVPLPPGATDLSITVPAATSAMVRTGEGLVDTRPVIPGQHEYVLSYVLPCQGPTYNLLKPIVYPADALDVLVAAPGAEVDAPALERLGTRETSGATYEHLGGRSLARDTDVVLRLSGLKQPASMQATGSRASGAPAEAGKEPWTWSLLPLAALGALGLAAAWHVRRTEPEPWPIRPAHAAPAMEREGRRVLVSLADLDERYEAGELDDG
ncbi:MAG: carboxypeptidase-like regulatory domain-containing protein, partial [Anaerolineae bacterium]|nr:carboxypeptidase-like regulatory domain-containing protein [Anaerolineae bacterium]